MSCRVLPLFIGALSILSSLVLDLCRIGVLIASKACLKIPLAVNLSSLCIGVWPRVCNWLCTLTGAAIIDVLLLGTFCGLDLSAEEDRSVCEELISRGCMTFSAKLSKEEWSLTLVSVRMYCIRSSYLHTSTEKKKKIKRTLSLFHGNTYIRTYIHHTRRHTHTHTQDGTVVRTFPCIQSVGSSELLKH